MKNTYLNLIEQSYEFPQAAFNLHNGNLTFHNISIKYLIDKYSTPFKLVYLPSIGNKIKKANNLFKRIIKSYNYDGEYYFCYSLKSCHFRHVISTALKFNANLETSSSFEIDLVKKLYNTGELRKDIYLIHNGYKTDDYLRKIVELGDDGFHNSITIIDSENELDRLIKLSESKKLRVGFRMSVNEQTNSSFRASRLGISSEKILNLFEEKIKLNRKIELRQLHFFIDSGINESLYYWKEFNKALNLYIVLKKQCNTLKQFNIGGGFPVKNNLGFNFDYEKIANQIVTRIMVSCKNNNIPEPDIFTEFGKYTVGESAANIFKVVEQKKQNNTELWYITDNSLINTMPDIWAINTKFILLPINKWNNEYEKVKLGGITCDRSDYYSSEDLNQKILLPKFSDNENEPLYIGFFHTGAYQDAVSGYGGIKHCLVPAPKQIIIDRDDTGNLIDYIYRKEQNSDEMLNILGYK